MVKLNVQICFNKQFGGYHVYWSINAALFYEDYLFLLYDESNLVTSRKVTSCSFEIFYRTGYLYQPRSAKVKLINLIMLKEEFPSQFMF